jgi:hypothetical protein
VGSGIKISQRRSKIGFLVDIFEDLNAEEGWDKSISH